MSCESPKEQLFAYLERGLAQTVRSTLEQHHKGEELLLGKPAAPSSVPVGSVDYRAVEMMCLECVRAVVGKFLALADGIAAIDDESALVKVVAKDGEDLGGDLLNEYQLYYYGIVEPPDR